MRTKTPVPFRVRLDTAIYAAGHFLVDFSCALVMLSLDADPVHFLVYNFLAFAVQMPIGLLADIVGRNRRFALTGVCLVLLGFLPCPVPVRVTLVGLGNSCYHVGGGREALLKKDGLTELGFFVSPGAIGIFLGTMLSGNRTAMWTAAILLAVCGILILLSCSPEKKVIRKGTISPGAAGLMLLVVILRSLVGMCMETPWKLGIYITLGAVAGAFGKFLGGFWADRCGTKRTGVISLILAALLFFLPDVGIAGVLGMLLFNMTMPITLGKASESCPGYEGFSFGLLTFGLFIGYLPSALGITFSPVVGAGLSLISAGLLMFSPEDRHG